MKFFTTISAIIICLTVSIFIVADAHALSKLGKKIQKELDINPFLKKEGVKLRVAEEESGYVTIEMYEGSREVREQIQDDPASLLRWASFKASDADEKVVFVIGKALAQIEEMKGVKDIMLTAAVGTSADQAEDERKRQEIERKKQEIAKKEEEKEIARQKQISQQILDLEAKIDINRNNPTMNKKLADLYFYRKQYQKAIDFYTRAIEWQPKKSEVYIYWYDLGMAYKLNGEPEKAIKSFDMAISIMNRYPPPRYEKGAILHYDLGRTEEAIDAWKWILYDAPNFKTPNGTYLKDLIEELK